MVVKQMKLASYSSCFTSTRTMGLHVWWIQSKDFKHSSLL